MITKHVFKVLSTLCLLLAFSANVLAPISQALTIYPLDYTFTGFGRAGTTASIDITDSSTPAKIATFDGIVKPDGTYSIPAKFATKDGTIAIKVETLEAIDATAFFYDLSDLDLKPGSVISPAILPGKGATPNATVQVELPDGSSFITKADANGDYKTPITNVLLPGDVVISELDSKGLVIGEPKTIPYDGGITVISATQAITTPPVYTAPSYLPAETTTPVVTATNNIPAVTPTKVVPTAQAASKVATVRTGGSNEFTIPAIIVITSAIILFVYRNRFSNVKK